MLEICLLGRFELRRQGAPITLPSRPAQTLLSYLALHPGPHRREALAGTLWPEALEANARASLRQALWHVRRAIGGAYVRTDDLAVAFNTAAPHWLDVQALLTPAPGRAGLEQALATYAGDLLPGFYADWVGANRDRLQAVFDAHAQALMEQLALARDWPALRDWAERWLAHGRPVEPAYRALMTAHAQLGDLASAHRAYQRCRAVLQRELEVDPAPETEALYTRLATLSPPAPLAAARLPAPLTSFVGRRTELAQIAAQLAGARLVTLTGAGGIGKSRLALEAARQAADAGQLPAGVWLAALAPVRDPAAVAQAVAQAMGLPEGPALAGAVGRSAGLLVLDNCEHLAADCAVFVEAALTAGPALRVLATSREPLGVPGEVVFQVPPLAAPGPTDAADPVALTRFDAVRLFCERAVAAQPAFTLQAVEAPAVQRIVRDLEGLPLAIELAAARAAWLSPQEIADRLEALLRQPGGPRTAPARQQTLRAALDWSYALLTAEEQALFPRLAVFARGWDLEAVEAVCDGALPVLEGLAARSMVLVEPQPAGRTRYRLLEPVRQYAAERLAASAEHAPLRARHCAYMQATAARLLAGLRGPEPSPWLARADQERDNLRAALEWARAVRAPALTALAGLVGALWLEAACRQSPTVLPATTQARLLYTTARLAQARGQTAEARAMLAESRRLFLASGEAALADRCVEDPAGHGPAG